MFGPQLELDILGQAVVDHHRAEQSRLGLDILGQAGGALGGDSGAGRDRLAIARSVAAAAPRFKHVACAPVDNGHDRAIVRSYLDGNGRSAHHRVDARRTHDPVALGRYRAGTADRDFRPARGKSFRASAQACRWLCRPLQAHLRVEEGRLALEIHRADESHLETLVLASPASAARSGTISRSATAITRRSATPRPRRSRRSTWPGAGSTTSQPNC